MRYAFVLVPLAALLAAACGGNGSPPTLSPTLSPAVVLPSPTAEPTATAATPTPAPKEVDGPIPLRTGIAELDVIIHGFVEHDTKRLLPLLRYQALPCTTEPPELGWPPLCQPNQEDGTPTEGMPLIGCHIGLIRPHEFEMRLIGLVEQDLYGVYEATPGTPEFRTSGEYVVLLSMPLSNVTAGTGVVIEDGQIVGVFSGCVASPEELVETHSFGEPLFRPDGQ